MTLDVIGQEGISPMRWFLLQFTFFFFLTPPLRAGDISVMTFNVENLFDTKHDEGKDDRTFLPLSEKKSTEHILSCGGIRQKMYQKTCVNLDWNDAALRKKMELLSQVVTNAFDKKNDAERCPDILGLVEVENLAVLERWRREFLGQCRYQPGVLVEGNDIRGIDVALFTRFPLLEPAVLHDIRFKKHRKKGTERGILQVKLELPDMTPLTVFVVHLLAPSNLVARRVFALGELNGHLKKLPKDALAIAMGDFNITRREEKKLKLFEGLMAEKWLISHRLGCETCVGTHYTSSKKEWSFFDAILFSKSFAEKKAPWSVDPRSIATANRFAFQSEKDGTPKAFDPETGSGVSDHFPVVAELRKTASRK